MNTKSIFLSLLLVVVTLSLSAQYKKYTFGLKAAPQVAWMKPNIDDYEGNGAKIGFSWGFVSEFAFSDNHCIATGFNVHFNGGNLSFPYEIAGEAGTMNRKYDIKSIEVPLTLKMRTNKIGNMKYFGQIGLGTAFRFQAKSTDEFVNAGVTQEFEKANYEKIAFARESLIIGLGTEYTIDAGTTFSAGLNFNNGFTDILTGSNPVSSIKEKASLNFVEFSVAVLF